MYLCNSIFTQFVIHVSMCYTSSSGRDNFFQVSNDYWRGESHETQMHCLDRKLFTFLQQQVIFSTGLCKETAIFQLSERISESKIRSHWFITLLYLWYVIHTHNFQPDSHIYALWNECHFVSLPRIFPHWGTVDSCHQHPGPSCAFMACIGFIFTD